MRKLLFTVVALFAVVSLSAQDVFKKGDLVGNLGIGIGNTLHGSGYSGDFPPISLSGEYGVIDGLLEGKASIGVGGYLAYSSSSYKYGILGDNFKVKFSDFVIGARGAFHYQFLEKLDTYAGLMLAYDIVSVSGNKGVGSYDSSTFFVPVFVGARYYLTENLGVMAELGYGVSVLNIGVSYKF